MSRTKPNEALRAIEQAYSAALAAAGREYNAAEGAAEKAYREAAKKAWDARLAALADLGEVPDGQ